MVHDDGGLPSATSADLHEQTELGDGKKERGRDL